MLALKIFSIVGIFQQLRNQEEGWVGACGQVQQINIGPRAPNPDGGMRDLPFSRLAPKLENICLFMQSCCTLEITAVFLQRFLWILDNEGQVEKEEDEEAEEEEEEDEGKVVECETMLCTHKF